MVSCYQIGPGYISAILNNPKVKLYFTGSVGDRTERLMVLICSGPDIRYSFILSIDLNFPVASTLLCETKILYTLRNQKLSALTFFRCVCIFQCYFIISGIDVKGRFIPIISSFSSRKLAIKVLPNRG